MFSPILDSQVDPGFLYVETLKENHKATFQNGTFSEIPISQVDGLSKLQGAMFNHRYVLGVFRSGLALIPLLYLIWPMPARFIQ